MQLRTSKSFVLFLSLLAGACAPIRYDVLVDAHDRGPMPPTARISVVAASPVAPRLGPEVKAKIERLVAAHGYRIVEPKSDQDSVDLVVLATFGAGQPPKSSGSTTIVQLGNLLPSVPRRGGMQTRWLIVAVARPSDLGNGSTQQAVPWLWYATTYSAVDNGSLSHVIDYLLVPTFEWFGRTTGSRINSRIEQYDPRVRVLANPPDEE